MKKYLFIAICLFLVLPAFAQTAAEIEALLNMDAVSYGQAVWLVFRAADVRGMGQTEAFGFALDQGWLPRGVQANDAAKLNGVSLLIMQAFEMRGGIFYGFTRSPHYAYRELVYRNIIQGRSDPAMFVSGDLLLFMVNRVLAFQEVNQL